MQPMNLLTRKEKEEAKAIIARKADLPVSHLQERTIVKTDTSRGGQFYYGDTVFQVFADGTVVQGRTADLIVEIKMTLPVNKSIEI